MTTTTHPGAGPYDYRVVEVLRVVDGDTVDLELDLGFHLSAALRFRVLGVDTPERGQPGYLEATRYVEEWLAGAFEAGYEVRAYTRKADAFGRWLADVRARVAPDVDVSLADDLIAAGHGAPYAR